VFAASQDGSHDYGGLKWPCSEQQPFRSLTPGVRLVIMRASGKGGALAKERVNPWRQNWVRQIPVTRLQLGTGRGSAGDLAALRVHFDETVDFVAQRLNHSRTVGLVLDQLELGVRPVGAESAHGQQSSGEIQSIADLVSM